MKSAIALGVLAYALIVFTPHIASALPLPTYAESSFSGQIVAGGQVIPVAGSVKFSLLMQGPDDYFQHLTNVVWRYSLLSDDGQFSLVGHMQNDLLMQEDYRIHEPGITSWIWEGVHWESYFSVTRDDLSGLSFEYGRAWTSGPSWDLLTNAFFLPSTLWLELGGESAGYPVEGYAQIDLSMNAAPVPEPGTITLGVISLLTAAGVLRRREGR